MFRRKILERQSEPDALDQLLVVVTPRSVLAVLALAGVLAVALIWSVTARIPVKVDGQGILMRPGFVTQLQASAEGRITNILIAPGDRIAAGEAVAALSQPAIERELDRLNAQFDIRRAYANRQIALATRARELEKAFSDERRGEIEEQLASLEDLRRTSVDQREIALADRRDKLARIEGLLERQRGEQQERMDGVASLAERGLVNNGARLSALAAVTSSAIEAARVELQISETRLSEISAVEEELQLIREIQNARAELTRIDIEEQQSERGFQSLIRAEQETVEEIAAQIRSARQELASARRITSPFDAVVLERLADESELIGVGGPVAMVRLIPQRPFLRVSLSPDAEQGAFRIALNGAPSDPLPTDATGAQVAAALAALPALDGWEVVGDGRLDAGPVDIRFVAGPEGVAAPELDVEMRDRDLWTVDERPATGSARILGVHAPDRPLVHVGFFPIGLAKQIAPSLEIRIDPSSVERERFGSLVGTVTSVSEFAITEEGLMQVVGNSQIAQSLVGPGGGVIMIEAALNPDPDDPSGFEWTSRSPDFAVTEGTTTTAHVVTEDRLPISFLIPLLRRWLLGERATPATAVEAAQRLAQ